MMQNMQKPIPIMQLIDGFATEEQSGGAALFGIQLARHLDRNRYAPFVCGLWRYDTPSERRWREQLHAEGIGTTILIDQHTHIAKDMLRAAGLLWDVVNRIRPRIMNSHFERGDMLGLLHKLTHPSHPHIVRTMHADQQWQTRPWLGAVLNLAAFPWFFDGEVAISRATQTVMDNRLAAKIRGRRAMLLYNGISSKLLQHRSMVPRRDILAEGQAPRFVIVGRLEPQKGHEYFLQASAEVLRYIPNAECWVVGTGSLRQTLQAQVDSLDIAHAVRFLGQRSDVPDLLRQVDVLVSASIWEGFPTVILEAMSARVPVIATDVSGSRELVRNDETGVLVPMAHPEALAQAMRWMLDHPIEARHMAERAYHEVHTFTIEATAEGYGQLYERVQQS